MHGGFYPAALKSARVRSAIQSLLEKAGRRTATPFAVRFPDGTEHRSREGEPAFTLVFRNAKPYLRIAAFGHVGMRIENPADIEPALKEAFSRKDDLVFMDFVTDQTENVFPMVPGGKGMSEMILSEEL